MNSSQPQRAKVTTRLGELPQDSTDVNQNTTIFSPKEFIIGITIVAGILYYIGDSIADLIYNTEGERHVVERVEGSSN